MTTLVTGANGFIGSHLVRVLLAAGHQVRGVLKPGTRRDTLADLDLELLEADVRDAGRLRTVMRGCRDVFHLASHSQLWARDKRIFNEVNYKGTENVVRAACQLGVRRLVYTSSCAFLGLRQRARGEAGDERDVPSLATPLGAYSKVKFLAERLVLENAERLDCVVVNPSIPLGRFDTSPSPQGLMVRNYLTRRLPGYLERVLNLVDVRDCARGHLLALEQGRRGERYILGGPNLRLSDVLERIEQLTGIPRPVWSVPYSLALASARVMEWWARISGKVPQASLEGVRSVRGSFAFTSAKAARELGYRCASISEGLAESVAWHRNCLAAAGRQPS